MLPQIYLGISMKNLEFRIRIFCLILAIFSCALLSFAGVSRAIQEQYKKGYENKALYLKIPIYSEKQTVNITGQSFRAESGTGTPRYKVGDQLRVLLVDFAGEEVKFRLGGISAPGFVELVFKFDSSLQESFPNRDVFDKALQSTLTEGLKYSDIDEAKDTFVREQFDRNVREIAGSASISKEAVLKNIAPYLPAFQEAQRDIETMRSRLQDISAQLSQSQSENRKLESDSKAQQTELSRLKSTNANLQEKLDGYTSQISKLGDEVRDARGNAQGYQKELASIQRSLNIRVDSNRDLTAQITDLGQVLKKLQKENDSLGNQISSLRTNLDAQQAANARLVGENEELKTSNRSLQSTLNTVTSSKDSLGRQFLNLKTAKEKLDDFSQTISALRTRTVEASTADGMHRGKANIYVKNILFGSLDWSIPAYLNRDESKSAEANVSVESIDYMRATPEERHILRTLGERFKIRIDLNSGAESMAVTSDPNKTIRELGERDHASWKWSVNNRGTKDSRLNLTVRFINKDSNEISILQQDHLVAASNVVRQVRGYLQPIPLIVGIIIGFVLLGIVGIFRRPKTRADRRAEPKPAAYVDKKQL
jgi:predicted nuclease with TOPRIM domain